MRLPPPDDDSARRRRPAVENPRHPEQPRRFVRLQSRADQRALPRDSAHRLRTPRLHAHKHEGAQRPHAETLAVPHAHPHRRGQERQARRSGADLVGRSRPVQRVRQRPHQQGRTVLHGPLRLRQDARHGLHLLEQPPLERGLPRLRSAADLLGRRDRDRHAREQVRHRPVRLPRDEPARVGALHGEPARTVPVGLRAGSIPASRNDEESASLLRRDEEKGRRALQR